MGVGKKAQWSIERYKAHWVAKGFKQVHGIDYDEVFAPTYRMATIRLVCALAAHCGLTLYSLDVTAAFLNGDLEEDVYMKQPEGFEIDGPEYVCKLQKSNLWPQASCKTVESQVTLYSP
jgi:hypothetical protein